MYIGCHTSLAEEREIVKSNLKMVEIVTVLMAMERIRHQLYDSGKYKLVKQSKK